MKNLNILLKSIGCRTNQEEITSLGGVLRDCGATILGSHESADKANIIIINTCSVTGGTESSTRRMIKSLVRNAPEAKVLVTGCLAQQDPDELLSIPGVSWVVGNTEKYRISDIIKNYEEGLFYEDFKKSNYSVAVFENSIGTVQDEWRTRYPVKIQEGCDFRCSYCIVPLLRGPSRSLSKNKILETCKKVVNAGYKEIIITGTHIGQYSDGEIYTLVELLNDILKIDGDFRIRLSSLDPRDCTQNLLEFIAREKQICNHLHVSAQSFSTSILDSMGRMYKGYDAFLERLLDFRNKNQDAGIGGDFIVGYPGESEEMFYNTKSMIKKIGFNYGHIFRYSKRPGTRAAQLNTQIEEKTKSERSIVLRKCLSKSRMDFVNRQCNKNKHRIIVEKEHPVIGITDNYIRVTISDALKNRNTWQEIVLTEYIVEKNICMACLVKDK